MNRPKRELIPTAIDLFCGCGGLTEGLKQAGFMVIGAVDIDRSAVDTYKANHPEVTLWQTDIKTLKVCELKKKLGLRKGSLDLLAGCPPCQGFSAIRTHNGAKHIKDPRNDLILDFQRFIYGLKPKIVMLENVPGLASNRRFTNFCKYLIELGYKGDYRILNAADYGVPQRRRRLIYLASLKDVVPFAKKAKKRKMVKHVFTLLPPSGKSGDSLHDFTENRSEKIKKLIKKIPKNGGSRTFLPKRNQLACHKKCDGFKDVYGRMSWDNIAPTITTGCFNPSKGRFLHPTKNRAITMREAALLQSFPLRYKFPNINSKCEAARLIGNALPPEFIRRHATVLKKMIVPAKEVN